MVQSPKRPRRGDRALTTVRTVYRGISFVAVPLRCKRRGARSYTVSATFEGETLTLPYDAAPFDPAIWLESALSLWYDARCSDDAPCSGSLAVARAVERWVGPDRALAWYIETQEQP